MAEGKPDYYRLQQMGKLPGSARSNIPELAQIDSLIKRIEDMEKLMCEDCKKKILNQEVEEKKVEDKKLEFKEKCPVEGCDFVAEARTEGILRNVLRMHSKKHKVKET